MQDDAEKRRRKAIEYGIRPAPLTPKKKPQAAPPAKERLMAVLKQATVTIPIDDPPLFLAAILDYQIRQKIAGLSRVVRFLPNREIAEKAATVMLEDIDLARQHLALIANDSRFTRWSMGNLIDRTSVLLVALEPELQRIAVNLCARCSDITGNAVPDAAFYAGQYAEIDGNYGTPLQRLANEIRAASANKPATRAPVERGRHAVNWLCDKLEMSNPTLGNYAELAGVAKPGVGERNHRFTTDEVLQIARMVVEQSSQRKHRIAAEMLIEELSGNQKQIEK